MMATSSLSTEQPGGEAPPAEKDAVPQRQPHKWSLRQSKPKRRHSIQVISGQAFLSRQFSLGSGSASPASGRATSATDTASGDAVPPKRPQNRRQSISVSLQHISKSMSR